LVNTISPTSYSSTAKTLQEDNNLHFSNHISIAKYPVVYTILLLSYNSMVNNTYNTYQYILYIISNTTIKYLFSNTIEINNYNLLICNTIFSTNLD